MRDRRPPTIDELIIAFDRGLRTVFGSAAAERPTPGGELPSPSLSPAERIQSAALMRVNHTGEVCAQALYQGQALTARNEEARTALGQAAREETDHLAWTADRIEELGGRTSLLNPLFYGGSFTLGAIAGLLGDRWNLGFLAETERQVVAHLDGHLDRLPAADEKSRVIVRQMQADEARHATTAIEHGGEELPGPVKRLMRAASRVMTGFAYWV